MAFDGTAAHAVHGVHEFDPVDDENVAYGHAVHVSLVVDVAVTVRLPPKYPALQAYVHCLSVNGVPAIVDTMVESELDGHEA